MVYQHVNALIQILVQHGICTFFIAPGSRSAPLTLAAARHAETKTYVFNDERACGYAAMGHALTERKAAAVITTSGTAAINLFPAVAEGYFLQVPLIVLTADRPPEWIAQHDGQAVFQTGLFGKHVLQSYELPVNIKHEDEIEHVVRIANEACIKANTTPPGPVHINIPLREPLYPSDGEAIQFTPQRTFLEIPHQVLTPKNTVLQWVKRWLAAEKKMIIVGQLPYDKDLNNALYACNYYLNTPILADITSNLPGVRNKISHYDVMLRKENHQNKEIFSPDILITIGQGLLSKNIKQYLRTHKPKEHWHIQERGDVADVFQALSTVIRHPPTDFITKIGETGYFEQLPANGNAFDMMWRKTEDYIAETLNTYISKASFSDVKVVFEFIKLLPEKCLLHVANSMPVRYANLFTHLINEGVEIHANRGTSGIDGCLSTAVGAALASTKPVFIIAGDVATLYDRNALWLDNPPQNLKILVLNNGGGNIFSMIDGPAKQPELQRYFEGTQSLSCKSIATDFNLAYFTVNNNDTLAQTLHTFCHHPNAAILEVFTDKYVNKKILHEMYAEISLNLQHQLF
jgi:2-succinyl-5-enolpyruvyl-6-hydroxy-3-cyclohexene-1-carboxylate synthase